MDDCSRESPAIEIDTSIPGIRVVHVLDRLKEERGGLPKVIVIDNGPEFSGKALDDWAWRNNVKLHFIDPGKPQQNGVHRKLQRNLSQRLPESKLVLHAGRSKRRNRKVEARLQRISSPQLAG